MSTTGQDHPGQVPGVRDARAMTEDEWRASLPSFGQQLGTGLGPTSTFSAPAPAPSVAPFSTTATWQAHPTSSNTAAVWWLIFLPLIGGLLLFPGAIAIWGLDAVWGYMDSSTPDADALTFLGYIWGVSLLFGIATLLLGFRDRATLRQLGHQEPASPWWQLLSQLVYLVIRTVAVRRETGQGQAPLVVYLCIQIAPIVLGIIAAIAIPALIYAAR